jgi:hypothetical protein
MSRPLSIRDGARSGIKVSSIPSFYVDGADLKTATLNLVWPTFIGGCTLTRDTDRWLKEVGSWSKVDLYEPEGQTTCTALPHTMGMLTK